MTRTKVRRHRREGRPVRGYLQRRGSRSRPMYREDPEVRSFAEALAEGRVRGHPSEGFVIIAPRRSRSGYVP